MPNIGQLAKELRDYRLEDKNIVETDSVIAMAGALAIAPNPDSAKVTYTVDEDLHPLLKTEITLV